MERIRDYGINIGKLPTGKLNKITDVKGVKVGHCTVENEDNKTGVTVILPCEDNIFKNKMCAASFVLNGFGKTTGLLQIDELGTLESPIALTNTLNVGLVQDGLIEYMLKVCKEDSTELKSINTVIAECNDSHINSIEKRACGKDEVFEAIKNAASDFPEGAVGAGRGTICYGLKGGIGSSSRVFNLNGKEYTIGCLVQSNYGATEDLRINGNNIGEKIKELTGASVKVDRGSIIMVAATDAPLSSRQLKRVIKRCSVGLARLGSYTGNGSGEVIIGFSTAMRFNKDEECDTVSMKVLNENKIDLLFRAMGEACEEAVLNSMITSSSDVRLGGEKVHSLKEFKELF